LTKIIPSRGDEDLVLNGERREERGEEERGEKLLFSFGSKMSASARTNPSF
jgi:hypothetical protein